MSEVDAGAVEPKAADRNEADRNEIDARVEGLAQELVDVINLADPADRADLREYAADLVRGATETTEVQAVRPDRPPAQAGNPIGMALLLGVFSAPMLLIFPPVGLVLAAVAVVLGVVGVAMSALRR